MNKVIDRREILSGALRRVFANSKTGIWEGKELDYYFMSCRYYIQQYEARIIFTRDVGYHSGGWWKNPDYERCYHLSISFEGERNMSATEEIVKGLFGDDKKLLWTEPPYSPEGKHSEVWHYRLFCDIFWQPIKPRGEVYSTQFTERGWKSFSELHT